MKTVFTTKRTKFTKVPSFILPRNAGEERGGGAFRDELIRVRKRTLQGLD
jgi:hypothetical protein